MTSPLPHIGSVYQLFIISFICITNILFTEKAAKHGIQELCAILIG